MKITNNGVAHLRKLTNLRALNLFGTQITDAGLAQIGNMTQLRELFLTDLKVSPEAVAELKRRIPGVKVAGP